MAEETKAQKKKFHVELVKQLLTLATSGFGLTAALAWNGLIREFVDKYIKAWFPESGLLSLLIYAFIVTALAVFVTYQLSKLGGRLQEK